MHVRLRSPRLHRDAAFVPLAAYAQSCGTNGQYPWWMGGLTGPSAPWEVASWSSAPRSATDIRAYRSTGTVALRPGIGRRWFATALPTLRSGRCTWKGFRRRVSSRLSDTCPADQRRGDTPFVAVAASRDHPRPASCRAITPSEAREGDRRPPHGGPAARSRPMPQRQPRRSWPWQSAAWSSTECGTPRREGAAPLR